MGSVGVFLSEWDFISVVVYLVVRLLDHEIVLNVLCWGISILFPVTTLLIYTPTNSSLYSICLLVFVGFCLFDDGQSTWHEVISHCGLLCIHHFPHVSVDFSWEIFLELPIYQTDYSLFSCLSSLYILNFNPLSELTLFHSVSSLCLLFFNFYLYFLFPLMYRGSLVWWNPICLFVFVSRLLGSDPI